MFLKFKISCTCHCEYTVCEEASITKIVCPNCGLEYPYSDKLLSILNTAKDIPDGAFLSSEVRTKVISLAEDTSSNQ